MLKAQKPNLYFSEPRFLLTAGGEYLVRIVAYATDAFLLLSTLILLIYGTPNMKWLGGLIALFFIDRLIHLHDGERTIDEARSLIKRNKKVNLADIVSKDTYKILNSAFRKSYLTKKDFSLVLLKKIIKLKDVQAALTRLDINPKDFIKAVSQSGASSSGVTKKEVLQKLANLVEAGFYIADSLNEKFIEPRNLLIAIAQNPPPAMKTYFQKEDISIEDIQTALVFGRFRSLLKKRKISASIGSFAHKNGAVRKRIMNRAWTARPTPFLDKFSVDLTALAKAGRVGLLIGHQQEYNQLLNVLARPEKPNALLVGEPGAGKSTIISHLAYNIIKDKVPKILFDKRLISIEVGSLIANANAEEIAGRLQKISEEIILAGNIVLVIPNIHNLFKTLTTGQAIKAIDVFLPIIKSNAIPIIGESYPREFKQFIEPNSDFLEQFETVKVKEISPADAVKVLTYESILLENQFNILISAKSVKKAVDLAYRYLRSKPLPGAASDLLKQALAKARQENMPAVTGELIVKMVEELSQVPVAAATGQEAEKLLNLEEIIHRRLINQEEAVKAVSQALREYRSGLSRKGGPIAAFLFVGPTGVGKTQLSKILTAIQFGSESEMIRFDMSEYQDKTSIFRFIGTPDGSKTGALTDAVLAKPYSLILLDEFEKAHPDILNLFLQVFDDGRLTDGLGRTVNFEHTIIIATSNAHSDLIKERIEQGRSTKEISIELKKRLVSFFRPELLNRFTDIIVFRALNPEEIYQIAGIMVKDLAKQVEENSGIQLSIEDSAIKEIARRGFSPVFGARPLREAISDSLKGQLAKKILKKEVVRGDKVSVSYQNGQFIFQNQTNQ